MLCIYLGVVKHPSSSPVYDIVPMQYGMEHMPLAQERNFSAGCGSFVMFQDSQCGCYNFFCCQT
eukprot:13912672-Ditylum_brightwellii.AAC.1